MLKRKDKKTTKKFGQIEKMTIFEKETPELKISYFE